jgi:hypothetical protein
VDRRSSPLKDDKATSATMSDTGLLSKLVDSMNTSLALTAPCKPKPEDETLRLLLQGADSVKLLLQTCR